jgi:hypothetical protein
MIGGDESAHPFFKVVGGILKEWSGDSFLA